jgi:hypothetical protein
VPSKIVKLSGPGTRDQDICSLVESSPGGRPMAGDGNFSLSSGPCRNRDGTGHVQRWLTRGASRSVGRVLCGGASDLGGCTWHTVWPAAEISVVLNASGQISR